MNRNAVLKMRRLSLLAMACFACSVFLGAQQNSGATGSGLAPTAGASRMAGVYSTEGPGLDRESVFTPAGQIGSKSSNQGGKFNDRSTWTAGANSGGGSNAAAWVAGEPNFRERSALSWIAGAGNFSLNRQQGGIWRLAPYSQVQSNTSVELNDLSAPLGMTLKGAALIKGAVLSSSFTVQRAKAFGTHRFATSGAATPFSAHAPRPSGFGTGIGVKSTELTPSSATISGPSLHDTPSLDLNLPSLDPQGGGSAGANGDTSH